MKACVFFMSMFKNQNPDILCIQETKAQPNQVSFSLDLPEYNVYWNSAEKKGYSGVLTFSKIKPISIIKKIGNDDFDTEGRFLQMEYDNFFLINLYFPNSQRGLIRLGYKLDFNKTLLNYIEKLRISGKSIILCGDFNVAHKEIDIKNPKSNQNNAGFSPPERAWFTDLIDHGYIDTFREFNEEPDQYTWWTYRTNAREKNIGWRVDYFVINKEFRENVTSAFILQDIMGSDHAPVGIELDI